MFTYFKWTTFTVWRYNVNRVHTVAKLQLRTITQSTEQLSSRKAGTTNTEVKTKPNCSKTAQVASVQKMWKKLNEAAHTDRTRQEAWRIRISHGSWLAMSGRPRVWPSQERNLVNIVKCGGGGMFLKFVASFTVMSTTWQRFSGFMWVKFRNTFSSWGSSTIKYEIKSSAALFILKDKSKASFSTFFAPILKPTILLHHFLRHSTSCRQLLTGIWVTFCVPLLV